MLRLVRDRTLMQPLSPAALAEILPGCTAYFPTCDPHLSPINAHSQGGSGVVRRTRKRGAQSRGRVSAASQFLALVSRRVGLPDFRLEHRCDF
jgi:hypothetical protein